MRNFRKFDVWRESHELTLRVYSVSREFPRDERFGLTSQLRRAVVSVESNIAEGAGRRTDKVFAHYLDQASGSATEVETQLLIARDLEYLPVDLHEHLDEMAQTVKKLLAGFQRKLRS